MGILFDDNSKTYKYLSYRWGRSNQWNIEHTVEDENTPQNRLRFLIFEAIAKLKADFPSNDETRKPIDPKII